MRYKAAREARAPRRPAWGRRSPRRDASFVSGCASRHGDAETVRLRVANEGAPLDAAALEALFEPLRRGGEPGERPA